MGDWRDVSVGGAVALMLLREVFSFLQKRQANGKSKDESTAGDKPVEYYLLIYQRIEGKIDLANGKLDELLERK